MTQSKDDHQKAVNTILTIMVGQVGCLTLAVIMLALFAGLWLDRIFNTRPFITGVLLIGSIPITLFLMYRVSKATIDRIKPASSKTEMSAPKEDSARDS